MVSRRSFLKGLPFLVAGLGAGSYAFSAGSTGNLTLKNELENLSEEELFDSKLEAAARLFPDSEPYIGQIVSAHSRYKNDGAPPIEYIIGLIQQESAFDKHAVSSAFATGLMQIIRPTSLTLGLENYGKDSPELEKLFLLEKITEKMRKKMNHARRAYGSNLRRNQFDRLEENKKLYDGLNVSWNVMFGNYKRLFKEAVKEGYLTEEEEHRLDPEKSINAGVRHLSSNIEKFYEIYGGEPVHNIIRGIAAYNAGFATASKWYGLPAIQETIDHGRKTLVNADKIKNESLNVLLGTDNNFNDYRLPSKSR